MSETVEAQTGVMQGEKRRKRVLTDARKTQNRLAQRAYRQRQKEHAKASQPVKLLPNRLHELRPRHPRQPDEVECSSGVPSGLVWSVVPGSTQGHLQSITRPQTDTDVEQEQVNLLQEPMSSASIPWSDVPNQAIDPDDVYQATLSTARFIADVDSTVVRPPLFGSMGIPFADFGDCSNIEPGVAPPSTVDYASGPLPYDASATIFNPVVSQSLPTSSFQDEDARNDLLGVFPMLPESNASNSHQDPSTSHLFSTTSLSLEETSPSVLPTQDLARQTPPTPQAPTLSNQQRQLAILTLWHSPHSPSITTIPSPYLNLLTPYQTGIVTAFIHNARVLSIARHELLTNSPLSPFYRPTNTSTSPATLLASLPSHYPPHLQPTLPQVLFKHHAYLDLLPFPVLRARAIAWAASSQGLFDPRELKMDIVIGGLVCRRDEYGGGGGQPWDARSWTVAGWFRVKWRLLLC